MHNLQHYRYTVARHESLSAERAAEKKNQDSEWSGWSPWEWDFKEKCFVGERRNAKGECNIQRGAKSGATAPDEPHTAADAIEEEQSLTENRLDIDYRTGNEYHIGQDFHENTSNQEPTGGTGSVMSYSYQPQFGSHPNIPITSPSGVPYWFPPPSSQGYFPPSGPVNYPPLPITALSAPTTFTLSNDPGSGSSTATNPVLVRSYGPLSMSYTENDLSHLSLSEAEQLHRATLELNERVLGKEHPDTLASMNNLASVLDRQGKYKQAEQLHRAALELKESVLGKEHLDTLASMNNLALVLRHKGKYKEAEQLHRATLELKETVLGKKHPFTLANMNNLASVLDCQGKYKKAEQLYRAVLELKERMLGKKHPFTLASMNNLALVLYHQGKYEEAEQLHQVTLELKERVLGKEHPVTLASMNNLALVLDSQGKCKEAEQLHRATLELKERVLGKEHPDTLASMNNLAEVLHSQGKHEEAEQLHRQELELTEFGKREGEGPTPYFPRAFPSGSLSIPSAGLKLTFPLPATKEASIPPATLPLSFDVLNQAHVTDSAPDWTFSASTGLAAAALAAGFSGGAVYNCYSFRIKEKRECEEIERKRRTEDATLHEAGKPSRWGYNGDPYDPLRCHHSIFRHSKNAGMEQGPERRGASREPFPKNASLNSGSETDAGGDQQQGTNGISQASEVTSRELSTYSGDYGADIVGNTLQGNEAVNNEIYNAIENDIANNPVQPNGLGDCAEFCTSENDGADDTVQKDKAAYCDGPSMVQNGRVDYALQLGEAVNNEAALAFENQKVENGSNLPTANDDKDPGLSRGRKGEKLPQTPSIYASNMISSALSDLSIVAESSSTYTQKEHTQRNPSSYQMNTIATPFSITLPKCPDNLETRKAWHLVCTEALEAAFEGEDRAEAAWKALNLGEPYLEKGHRLRPVPLDRQDRCDWHRRYYAIVSRVVTGADWSDLEEKEFEYKGNGDNNGHDSGGQGPYNVSYERWIAMDEEVVLDI